jgi:glyoxylase-like metal-dependent hydrolase (beta-lactamase superfamily II)
VTHGHPDHFPGAAPLAAATGAPVYAHPDARFPHNRALADGELLAFEDAALTVLHAPGHARDHLVFVLEDERALFTGDVVIGTGTVVVAPPGGDMRTYQRTLHRLRDEYGDAKALYGGHGPEVRDVGAKLDEYIAHREARERQILDAVAAGADTIPALVERVYAGTEKRLWPAAARQILAYLLALEAEGRVRSERVAREPTPHEAALLNPDLSKLGDDAGADVIRAELGYGTKEALLRYGLLGG